MKKQVLSPKSQFQQFQEFFENLPDLENKAGESYYIMETTHPEIPGVLVDLTSIDNKPAIVLSWPGPLFKATVDHAKELETKRKVYFPESIETAFHDYDEFGKYMFAAKTDKLWFFEERLARTINGITCAIGMDMTAPFLDQQNWKEYK